MNSTVYYNKTMACSIASWKGVADQRLLCCFWKRRDEGFMHSTDLHTHHAQSWNEAQLTWSEDSSMNRF